jgi:N-acetyl-anhydromuramyl-L-alanine amidase AmpD
MQIHHRISVFPDMHLKVNQIKLVDFFAKPEQKTGGLFPYHFLVTKTGAVLQFVRLSRTALGAGKYNTTSINVAWEGDFRKELLHAMQWNTGVLLTRALGRWSETIKGHSDLSGASADPNKVCPGPFLSLDELQKAAFGDEGIIV